jgi:hypothetical protein
MLLVGSSLFAEQPGTPRSTFVPRGDAKASTPMTGPMAGTKIIPAQAKEEMKLPLPPLKNQEDAFKAYVRIETPGKERVFGTRDTEKQIEERMRQETKDAGRTDLPVFPEKPLLSDNVFSARQFPAMKMVVEPSYVVHRRLYFEEVNSERFGWEVGPLQPFVSALYFYKDFAFWPHNFASYPHRRFDTNVGKCLPGDPVPYICYPPEFTATGGALESGLIIALFYAVP